MPTITMSHVSVNEEGVAYVTGTTTKVIEVVLDQEAHGLSPAEIHAEHPHLSLAQIHAALSHYYDHKVEMDREIERRYRHVEALRAQATGQMTRVNLQARRAAAPPSASPTASSPPAREPA